MMVQAKVNDRVDTAVEKGQTTGNNVTARKPPFTSHVCLGELIHCGYGFEHIVGKPGENERNNDRKDHFERVSAPGFGSGVGGDDAVFVEMHHYCPVAEDDDQDRENEREQSHEEGQTEKKRGVLVLAKRVFTNFFNSAVQERWHTQNQRGKPHRSASYIDAPAASKIPGVHKLHHCDVSVNAHARQKKYIGVSIHRDDIAAQLAQEDATFPKFPCVILACRDSPEWQGKDKNQVCQCKVDYECIDQAAPSFTPAAHHTDDKKVAQKSSEKYHVVNDGNEDVQAIRVRGQTVRREAIQRDSTGVVF